MIPSYEKRDGHTPHGGQAETSVARTAVTATTRLVLQVKNSPAQKIYAAVGRV
jgi:hypothetical protein